MRIEAETLSAPRCELVTAELMRHPLPFDRIVVTDASKAHATKPGTFDAFCQWERQHQSYRITHDGATVRIVGGGADGALYGVWEVIKAATGIRWYGIADDDVAFAPVREDVSCTCEPKVVLRGFEGSLAKWDIAFVRKLLPWMSRNRLNMLLLNAAHWTESPHRREIASLAKLYGVRLVLGGHAPQLFLPHALFEEHPEYFGLRDGKRCLQASVTFPDMPGREAVSPIQPCYSNPQALAHMADAIAGFIDKTPELDVFSLWPHDGINNWCQCEHCIETTPFEMLYTLALAIIERARREVPIEVLCYTNTLDVPRKPLTPSDRIYVLFCPYLRRYEHRFYDGGFDAARLTMGNGYPDPEPVNPTDDREYGVLLDRWLKHIEASGAGLGVFAYYQLVFHDETGGSDRSRYLYHPDPDLVGDELERFWQCGMKVFYDCSWPIPGFWPDARLYAYLPEVLWDTRKDVGELIDVYYTATLGAQAAAVREVLDRVTLSLGTAYMEAALDDAEVVLSKVASSRGKRYRLWLKYVRLAARSRAHFLAGDKQKVIAAEREVIALLEASSQALDAHLGVAWMQRYAQAVIDAAQTGTTRGALPTG